MKKISISLLAIVFAMMILAVPVHAEGFTVGLTADKKTVTPGSTFTISVNVQNLDIKDNDGLLSFDGQLEYDTNILEPVTEDDIVGSNGFSVSYGATNNKMYATTGSFVNEDAEVAKITFKVKANATLGDFTIKVKNANIVVGIANVNIRSISNAGNEIKISVKNIESDKYQIEDEIIKGVPSGTTGTDLKNNIKTGNATITIFDKDGNTALADNDVLGTGAVVKVNGTDSYTIIVNGDLSGDGKVTIHDLGIIKRHLTEKITLEGAYLKAADLDNNGAIDSVDMVFIIQHIIGIITL